MIKNYLKTAIRNIRRNKLYASLNILGLSIGLGSFFIIYLFLQNELAYDQFHEKKDRIYRVIQSYESDFGTERQAMMSDAFSPKFVEPIAGIEAFTRVFSNSMGFVFNPGEEKSTTATVIVDSGFLDIFSIDIIRGSETSALESPNSMLISESAALKNYGTTDVIGKEVDYYGRETLVISAVFKDWPNSSSIKAEAIALYEKIYSYKGDGNWSVTMNALQTYMLLNNNTELGEVESKLTNLYLENNKYGEGKTLSLQPLGNVHYSLDVKDEVREKTDRQYITVFSLVAFFILVCAIINYISLAVSQSVERSKEIGVRKVAGASKRELFVQFIIESFLHVTAAFVCSMILVELLIPQLESLIERDLNISVLNQPILLAKGAIFSVLIALISSLYPAYLSTRLRVVSVFRNGYGAFSSQRLIGIISLFQISVFVVLICVSATANRQMHFMRNENLGFDKEHQLVLDNMHWHRREVDKNELLKISGVKSVSGGGQLPNDVTSSMSFPGHDFKFRLFEIERDYFETLGIDFLAGRNFLPEDQDSSKLIVINATAAEKLGYDSSSAVGKTIDYGRSLYTIIGVVNDFHFASKKQAIEPALFKHFYEGSNNQFLIKLDGANWPETTAAVLEYYHNIPDLYQYFYFFLEDRIDAQYKQENVMITMLNTFTVIATLVAFIGLFGITGYSVKRRMKEMGIRKVLGAGFISIQRILNASSFYKFLLAVLIGIPIVVYWMEHWLRSFAYRIEMPVFLILGAITLASIVILLTVSIHSIKAYRINPVDILKDE
ncbi:MAG: ABC transporter permease [Cytophagia bacterium]|nr:ABC transporter permease [Cytophagia bacterium]